jgi:Asp-tRNA(Asn)/Glu-tRNA(Gln) amidotransferase A subunit family amidase
MLARKLMADGGLARFDHLMLETQPIFTPLTISAGEKSLRADPNMALVDQLVHSIAHPAQRRHLPGVLDYAGAYQRAETTPSIVARRLLDAIVASDRHDSPLRAFIACDQADLIAQADAATARIRAGSRLSVMDGVPVAVKDELDQMPYPTTVGTSFMGQSAAASDSTVVSRLRTAGALLVGKTNMHEIGINPSGFNLHHGTARNPYGLEHDPGGSSSGSAVAIAAGLCPVAIGADGGGSIRIPAALCGVVGLKATYGRISEHGAAPLCWSVAHVGPMGWTVRDVALVYAIIAGRDPEDENTLYQPDLELNDLVRPSLAGLRIGRYAAWYEHAPLAIVSACDTALRGLVKAGAEVVEIEVPGLDEIRIAHATTILTEMAASMETCRQYRSDFSPATRASLALGRALPAHYYVSAQRVRAMAMTMINDLFQHRVDLIATPTTGLTSPLIPQGGLKLGWSDLSTTTELMRFVFPFNLSGHPAISVPVGYDDKGLPIGLQLVAPNWRESRLLAVAMLLDEMVERVPPRLSYQLLP